MRKQTFRKGEKKSSEVRMRSNEGGEIVEGTGRGRKYGHSKVYTSKGLRDRRVRLSAHTAIDFYDVQDRLGYDRPSKAVDWLINKAKPFIEKLSQPFPQESMANIGEPSESCAYDFHLQRQLGENQGNHHSSASSAFNLQSPTNTLGLSLHLFQDNPSWQSQQGGQNQNQSLFVSSTPAEFVNHYQRIVTWNNEANKVESIMVNSQPGSEYCPSHTWNDIDSMASSSSEHNRFLAQGFCIPNAILVEEEDNGSHSASPNKN